MYNLLATLDIMWLQFLMSNDLSLIW